MPATLPVSSSRVWPLQAAREPLLPLIFAAYVLLYVLLDGLGEVHALLRLGISPWNPQAGLTLAFLIFFGPGRAWITAVATLLATLWGPSTLSWPVEILFATVVAVGYGLGAWLLRPAPSPWFGPPLVMEGMDSTGYLLRLMGIGAAVSLIVSAGLVLPLVSPAQWLNVSIVHGIAQHWIGDINGILTVAPLLLVLPQWRAGWKAVVARRWEALLQMLVIFGVLWLILWLREVSDVRAFYPLFVPMIWIALRWGVAGAVSYTVIIQLTLLVGLRIPPSAPSFTGTQFLLMTLAATGLLLGAVVTERRAGEARLRARETEFSQAMRFASVGEFASALTHELNQPITALVSYLQSARILAAPLEGMDPRLPGALEKAVHEAVRTSDILRGLRDFYHGTPQLTDVSLQEVVAAVLVSHEERLRRLGVQLHNQLRSDLPLVICDRIQLGMVLHNLLGNALDAIAAQGGTRRGIVLTAAPAGAELLFAVEDSGPGLTREAAVHLFQPFNTTKPDGMGLGLAISRSVLRSQGGDLWLEDSTLGGARFVMRLALAPSIP